MPADPDNRANYLVWIDMEMTGLQPDADRIIEIALLVTDPQLEIVAEGPAIVVHQPDEVLDAMDTGDTPGSRASVDQGEVKIERDG